MVSSVEYMVAAGNANGEVTVFQIQKELPIELASDKIAAALITPRPIERYTIKDSCRGSITSLEWSKNGMKLFSGDSNGIVMLTEFDFCQHISKSSDVINEKFGIVQMQFTHPWLLVSTLYRAIVCRKMDSGEWKVSQIGRTDRKMLNDFGAVFQHSTDFSHRKPPAIVCARPGFRFWLADVDGNVSHTFLLKDSVNDVRTIVEVPILNPNANKAVNIKDTYFGRCFYFMAKFIVTYCESMVFIIDLNKLKVLATIRRLRKIQYLTVNGNEIFIVEGGRSIVRVSIEPEHLPGGGKYVPANHTNLMSTDSNIEIQEETITQADECFELPPIENIRLDVPLDCRISEHNLLKEDKLLLEHSRKLEVFEKINTLDYDDSILFQSGTKKKKKASAVVGTTVNNVVTVDSGDDTRCDGIVEIGRQAEFFTTNGVSKPELKPSQLDHVSEVGSSNEFTTKPCLMLASFCNGASQDSLTNNTESKTTNDIKQNGFKTNEFEDTKKFTRKLSASQLKPLEFNYPNYSGADRIPNAGLTNGKCKKNGGNVSSRSDVSDDQNDVLDDCSRQDDSDCIETLAALKQCASNLTPTESLSPDEVKSFANAAAAAAVDRNQTKHFPDLGNLTKLWDINIEKYDENLPNQNVKTKSKNASSTKEGIENEWVFL